MNKNLTWHKIKYLDYGSGFGFALFIILPAAVILLGILSKYHSNIPVAIVILSIAIQLGAGALLLLVSKSVCFLEAWVAFDENGLLISYPGMRNSFNPEIHEHTEFSMIKWCYWREYKHGRKWKMKIGVKNRWVKEWVFHPFDNPRSNQLPDFFAEMKTRIEAYNLSSAAGFNPIITKKGGTKWSRLWWVFVLLVAIGLTFLVGKKIVDKSEPIHWVLLLFPGMVSEIIDNAIPYSMKEESNQLEE
jgi:hypothetical protein